MYLVSQKGNEVVSLRDVWVAKRGERYAVMHDSGSPNANAIIPFTELATYPTEDAAKMQISGIVWAIESGKALYKFD